MENNVNLSVMLDCSRNAVFKPEQVKTYIDYISKMGYKGLLLYTEETYEIEGEPYFGHMRGRYSKSELKDIDAYAKSKGIELIPCIQTLGHLGRLLRWTAYHKVMDQKDVLMVGKEDTYILIDKMFKTLAECFTSRKVNIGFDEAHGIGLGRYLSVNGYQKPYEILTKHLHRVIEIAESYGFKTTMWSDMFFRFANKGKYSWKDIDLDLFEKATKDIPKSVTPCYWDYNTQDVETYDKMFELHKKYMNNPSFACSVKTGLGYMPNNTFSIKTCKVAFESVLKNNITDVLLTLWGDAGGVCSFYSALPTVFSVSEFAKGNFDEKSIKEKFNSLFGLNFDDFLTIDKVDYPAKSDMPCVNPSRYMLYNDYFCGTWDCTVAGGESEFYKNLSKEIKPLTKNKQYAYIFKLAYHLSRVLELKYELGVKTHEAYLKGDKKTLKALANNEYTKLIKRLTNLSNAIDVVWDIENKTAGVEIEDIKIGGLIKRTKHCKAIILKYLKYGGEIAELKDPMLDFYTPGTTLRKMPIRCNEYHLESSINNLN